MHLYSKLKLVDPEIRFLVEDDIPSVTSTVELRNGVRILFYCLHSAPPSPTENSHSTERDGELLMLCKEANRQDKAVIVTGDLDDVAWPDTTLLFRRISELLDPRIGRGMFNSFHAKYWFIRWPLDHLFHSREFRICEIRGSAILGRIIFRFISSLPMRPIHHTLNKAKTAAARTMPAPTARLAKPETNEVAAYRGRNPSAE